MNLLKFRIAIPAAIFVCIFAACQAGAQTRTTIIQNSSGESFLGITMEDVTASNMSEYNLKDEKGVIVRSVQDASPAEEAAFRENDVILEFAGQPVLSTRQFSRLVSETPAGRKVAVTVSRDGKPVYLSATIGTRTGSGAAQRMEALPGQLERFFETLPPGGQIERFFESLPDGQARPPRNNGPVRPDAPARRQNADPSENRPRLGVEIQPLTEQMAGFLGVSGQKGVLVASVTGGSASDGKLKAGDVIIGVNDREVGSPADLTRFVQEASGEITVKVIRDKKQISVKINLPSDEIRGGDYRL
jgi:serine protease Do